MDKLLSKLQYEYYETGEFSDAGLRTCAETLEFIRHYPWVENCIITSVGVDKGGIVIEGPTADYLKIGNYYNNQFCLYYYHHAGTYFVHIAEDIAELSGIVTRYFSGAPIADEFNKEFILGVKKDFVSKDFMYTVTIGRIIRFMPYSLLLGIPFTILCAAIIGINGDDSVEVFKVFTGIVWIYLFGINFLLFCNYLLQSGNKYMRVSKGNDKFIFGTRKTHREYDKNDVKHLYVTESVMYFRGPPWIGFEAYRLVFKNGEEIRFNSLLLGSFATAVKFADVPKTTTVKFIPFARYGK